MTRRAGAGSYSKRRPMRAGRPASIMGRSNRTAAVCSTRSIITTRAGHNVSLDRQDTIGRSGMREQTRPALRPYLATTPNFASGTATPRQFLEQSLELLDAWEPRIGAFVCTNLPAARAAADRATERWRAGRPLSATDGMPVGIKDVTETFDMPTQMGSPLFQGCGSEKDAASVRALRDAGAVIVGKTVTTEFAASEPRGTRNPWNTAHTPGGSSSGSAAAVAVGAVSAALGTQVIGSVLRPASFCGCIGFKPRAKALNRASS